LGSPTITAIIRSLGDRRRWLSSDIGRAGLLLSGRLPDEIAARDDAEHTADYG